MTKPDQKNSLSYFFLLIVLILFSFVSILYARYQNVFNLNKIIITGTHELNEEEIIYIAGLKLGTNLLKISVLDITTRLEAEPYIRQALVYKRLPDGLVINIRERTPILLMEMENAFSADNQGILLPAPRTNRDIPRLTGIPSIVVTDFGKTVLHPQIRQGVGIMSLIRKKYPEINLLINELHWSGEDKSWVLNATDSRVRIYIGQKKLKQKIQLLDAFLEQRDLTPSRLKKYSYIDLRYNKQVIVKPGR
jgi:cell division protein FtsQ